jgi:MFS family permease
MQLDQFVTTPDDRPAAAGPESIPGLTATQWLVCGAAGLGFAFDLYESLMNALIVGPMLSSLGHLKAGTPEFNRWVGWFFFVPSLAGGLFGLFGGYLTDLLGRRRVLVWSILLYSFSACAASFASSVPLLLFLRCTTMIGVSVEAVAAIAWVAELFSAPRQRETALAYTQACYALGGIMVTSAYYLAVTYGERLPAIAGSHDAWRYTLLSGLIPAIPLLLIRPFLPESPVWRQRKQSGKFRRPSLRELFRPAMRKSTLLTTVMMACLLAIPYGALQHSPRIVPGLAQLQHLTPQQTQQTVSTVFLMQELGSVTGRLIFVFVVIRIVQRQRLLRVFLAPAMVLFPALFFFAAHDSLTLFMAGIFCAQALFNGLHSFWGNYLPRAFPTYLRGTGEGFAMNIGGRMMGVFAVLLTTQLSNVMPGDGAASRLAYSAGTTVTLALVVFLVASYWLPEPRSDQLPD